VKVHLTKKEMRVLICKDVSSDVNSDVCSDVCSFVKNNVCSSYVLLKILSAMFKYPGLPAGKLSRVLLKEYGIKISAKRLADLCIALEDEDLTLIEYDGKRVTGLFPGFVAMSLYKDHRDLFNWKSNNETVEVI